MDILQNVKERNVLLRLFCEWAFGSSLVIEYIFKTVQSYEFFTTLYKDASLPSTTKTLLSILLGISFIKFPNVEGWTKESIFSLMAYDGLTTYFSTMDQENLKNVSLLWKNVNSEQEYFMSWFTTVISSIKTNIIQHLTTSSPLDDDSKLLIQKQQDEIVELRNAISHKENTLSTHQKELSIWKKRFDSFGDKKEVEDEISQMKLVQALEEDIKRLKLEYEEKLKSEQETIDKLREQLAENETMHKELVQEKEGLEEDLTALSSAYHTLEEMYNAKNDAGEASSESTSKQEGGEGTLETSIPKQDDQIVALQSEIQQLQESGRAAEEWMAMAVQRMDQLQLENNALKQQNESSAIPTSTATNEEHEKLQEENLKLQEQLKEYEVMNGRIQELENEKEMLLEEKEQKQSQDVFSSGKNDSLLEENTKLKQENKGLIEQLQTKTSESASTSEVTNLQREVQEKNQNISELEQSNAAAQEWMTNAVTHHQHLVQQVEALTSEKNNLLQQDQQHDQQSSVNTNEYQKLQDEYRNVQTQYQQLQDEKCDIQHDFEHKITNLGRKIEDMEDEKNVITKKYDDTLRLLQQSKMESDVVVKKLEEERNGLKTDLEKLSLKLNSLKENAPASTMDIDDEDELRQELYEAKHKLELLHEDIEKQKDEHERELLSIETKITQKLEEDHDDDQRHHSLEKEKLQNTIVDITLQKDNLQKNLQDLQSRHDAESRNHSEAMKNVKNKIMEYQTWVKTAQEKEAELKSDKKAAKSKCKELIQQTSLLKEEMDSLKKERNGLKEQLSTYENETVNKFDCMEGLEAQIKTLQETNAELESQNATLEMDNADLVDTISSQSEEIEGLKNENMEVTNNLTQSEQVVVDKMKEIDGLRDELTKQKQAMEEEFQQKNSVYVQQNNEEELKKYENRIGLLTQQKDELETQVYDNQTIHQEKINELESLLQQKDNELTQSIAEVQSTTQELTTLQEQSADVISKWKERAETLEVSVTNCQNEIKEKRKEAEDVISQWETHCSSLREQLEEQRQEGEEEWMNELCKKQGTIQELEGSLAGKEESLNQAEEEISILMKELQDMKNSSAEVVEQWKGMFIIFALFLSV